MSSPSQIIYDDANLQVEAVENGSSSYLLVFAVRLPVDIRGDGFFTRLGVNVIYLRVKSELGWAAPGLAEALEIVRERMKMGTHRVACGTGIGAVGAVAFGAQLDCESIVAISPDNLGKTAPGTSVFPAAIHIFFDNCLQEDRLQSVALAEAARVGGADARLHPLPFSGRPSNAVLLDTGILKSVLDALLAGKPASGWESYRTIRKTSRHLFLALMNNPVAIRKHPALTERAVRHFREHHAGNDKIALRYAQLLDILNRPESALAILQEVFTRSAKQATETHVFHARIQKRLGNTTEAFAAYNRALEDPKVDPEIKAQRDQLLAKPRQPIQEAWKKKEWAVILDLAKELDKVPLPPASDCALIGKAAFKLKKFALAEMWARRATMLDEGNAGYHGSMGDIFNKAGNLLAAVQSYTRAMILQPENTGYSLKLAEVLRASVQAMPGKSTIGLEMLHTAQIASPADELTKVQGYVSLLRQFGDFATAGQLLQKALQLDPENGTIERLLAEVNRHQVVGQDEESGREAKDEMSILPDVIASGLLNGNDWTTVYLQQVRLLMGQKQNTYAHTFCHALFSRFGADSIDALLCLAVLTYGSRATELPRQIFELIPQEIILKYAPVEYFSLLFIQKIPLGEELCLKWLTHHFKEIDSSSWLYCARLAAVHGLTRLADQILAKLLNPASTIGLTLDEVAEVLNMREILSLGARKRQKLEEKPKGRIHLGILNYRSLDYYYSSKNIGDHIQTLSLLSNLARFGDVSYAEGPSLAPFVRDLQKRIQPDRQLKIIPVEVELHEIQRDYSTCSDAPDGTWLIAFGWHMHTLFKERLDFPYRAGLRPIFISFHVSNPELLTDEAIVYLRKHGPIGCRDWYTVDLLRGHNIPAFFSGCLTSTIDNLIRVPQPAGPPANVGLVDLELPTKSSHKVAGRMTAELAGVKTRTQVENLNAAQVQLEGYAAYDLLYTSRLHCYLPMTSIGVPVDFRPKRASDTRFEGLSGFDIQTISRLRDPLLAKLEAIFRKILSGAEESEVYQFWNDLCAPDIAVADSYLKPIPDFAFPAQDHVGQILSRGIDFRATALQKTGAPINLAFAVDANLQEQFLVALESIQAHASRPLQVWLLSRELDSSYFEVCHKVFPEIDFHFLPCDGITYGNITGMLPNITVSTMDRLFLPELLRDIPQIIYLDIDILVRSDLAEMADLNLQGSRLAATNSIMGRWRTGYRLLESCAIRCGREAATELRRRVHARHDMRFVGFNAGVLILNLQRMREENFCEQFIPFAGSYGMNDQEVLNFYTGSDRLTLNPEWNCVPWQNLTRGAKLIHWAGASKPWNNRWLPGHDEWRKHEASVRARF